MIQIDHKEPVWAVEKMPYGDGTGPDGMGQMTGRGAGYCAGYDSPGFARGMPRGGRGYGGYGRGRGFGRGSGFGRGRGFGRGFFGLARGIGRGLFGFGRTEYAPGHAEQAWEPYAEPTKEEQKAMLEEEAKAIEQEQKALKEEMEYIKKKLKEFKK